MPRVSCGEYRRNPFLHKALAMLAGGLLLAACGGDDASPTAPPSGGSGAGSGDGASTSGPSGFAGLAGGDAGHCSSAIDAAAPVLVSGFTGNASNTRNFPSRIHAGNVAALTPAFVHIADGTSEKRGAPSMTTQAIFLAAGRDVVAIDRHSGCQYWSHSIPERVGLYLQRNYLRSSAVYYVPPRSGQPPLVLAGDRYGYIHALDARNGRELWSRFMGTAPRHHQITGAPQVHEDTLIVPVSSKEVINTLVEPRLCCTSHGIVRAVDLYTGATRWAFHTTDDARFQLSTGQMGPSGATVWGTPAIDAQRGRVYVGTGQNLSHPATDTSSAIVALDLQTGERQWVFQPTPGDVWNVNCEVAPALNPGCAQPIGNDFDFGAPPVLVRRSGRPDLLMAGGKDGVVYALDPDSGALRWSTRIGAGGKLGGVHWGMAVDDRRVYAAVSDATVSRSEAIDLGPVALVTERGIQPVPDANPGIYALDLDSGEVLWSQHPRHNISGTEAVSLYSAAISVTNDVVLAGSIDGMLRAFRSSDGAELWHFDSAIDVNGINGVSGNGGEIGSVGPIVADGDVLLNSGYDTFGSRNAYQAGGGNALFVLRLP